MELNTVQYIYGENNIMKGKYYFYNLCYDDHSPTISFTESEEHKMDNCHLHNHYEMLFMELGHLMVENNGKTLEVRTPAVILHNYFSLHRAETLEKGYRRWVVNFNDDKKIKLPENNTNFIIGLG